MIKTLKKTDNFNKIVNEIGMFLFQFGMNNCAPCHSIKNKLKDYSETNEELEIYYVPCEQFQQLAAKLSIFTVPTILLYVEGKQTLKVSGYFSLEEVFMKIERYQMMLEAIEG